MSTNFESRYYSTRESCALTGWSEKTFMKWAKVRGMEPIKRGWWIKKEVETLVQWVANYNSLLRGPDNLTIDRIKKLRNSHHSNNILVSITEGGINNLFHIEGEFAIVPVPSGMEAEYLQKISEMIKN